MSDRTDPHRSESGRPESGRPAGSKGAALLLASGLALCALGVAGDAAGQQQPQPLPTISAFATADSNDKMIAVTGLDVTGSSILYLVDTETRRLAVYQAQGGADSTMGIKLVGARNIDLDLRLDGYKDKSEYTFKELASMFEGPDTGD